MMPPPDRLRPCRPAARRLRQRAATKDAAVDGKKARFPKTPTRKPTAVLKRGGGFYKDDGPADDIPDGLDDIPDAEPKWEPLHKPATRPYVVLGKEYVPNTAVKSYKDARHRQLVRQEIPRPEDLDRRALRHVRDDRRPPDAGAALLRSRHQHAERQIGRRPRHRSRPFSRRPRHRPLLHRRLQAWPDQRRQRPGRGRGDHSRRATATTYAQVDAPGPAGSRRERDEIAQMLARRMALEERPVQTATMVGMAADADPPKGIYLQLGAFASADNADNLKNHLSRELDWLTEPMRIHAGRRHPSPAAGPLRQPWRCRSRRRKDRACRSATNRPSSSAEAAAGQNLRAL
jgi:rare lipoprotein A